MKKRKTMPLSALIVVLTTLHVSCSGCVNLTLTVSTPAARGKLHGAAEKGDIETVRKLLKRDPRSVNRLALPPPRDSIDRRLRQEYKARGICDFPEATPLHFAAAQGHKDIVEFLIENGADVNAKSEDGSTPLFIAVEMEQPEIAQLLFEQGAHRTAHTAAAMGIGELGTPILEVVSRGIAVC
ncbi:ankyrin repeat domain-containing protein [Candidatus Hydrogenedentota bacterium]